MKICLLASGSSGNCAYVSAGGTQVLIDAGIELARIRKGLKEISADQDRIDGLLLTHEHGDHCREAGRVALELRCPIYVSERTLPRIRWMLSDCQAVQTFRVGETFALGDLSIEAFRVFHDAIEPCGFLIEGPSEHGEGRVRLGIATDLGSVPEQLKLILRNCEALVIEANHDLEMLKGGDYPWDLKQRIRSPVGHLSNDAAAKLISELARLGSLKAVILAHLSENNNRPELALRAVEAQLDGLFRCEIYLSYHDRRSELVAI